MSPRNGYELMVVGGSISFPKNMLKKIIMATVLVVLNVLIATMIIGFLIKKTVDENSGNQIKSKKITTEAEEILEITTMDIGFKTTLNQINNEVTGSSTTEIVHGRLT